jgi:hypothetical protein
MPRSEEDELRGYLKTLGELSVMLGGAAVWFIAGYGLYSAVAAIQVGQVGRRPRAPGPWGPPKRLC